MISHVLLVEGCGKGDSFRYPPFPSNLVSRVPVLRGSINEEENSVGRNLVRRCLRKSRGVFLVLPGSAKSSSLGITSFDTRGVWQKKTLSEEMMSVQLEKLFPILLKVPLEASFFPGRPHKCIFCHRFRVLARRSDNSVRAPSGGTT